MSQRTITIPRLVRIKPGALDRVGIYLRRHKIDRVIVLHSDGLPQHLVERLDEGINNSDIVTVAHHAIADNSTDMVQSMAEQLADDVPCIVGLGGGKALDVAKHVAFLSSRVMFTVPTSLSNDGFASPQASLVRNGKRVSFGSALPEGVVIDTEVCLQAPRRLWLAGVGDLVSKLTAVRDWKLAFHHDGTPVDDFAALMSDASVFQFIGRPSFDLEGMRLLATALLLNGIAMSICGNSRPASGSEHLISHALDEISVRPRLHGLQVGVATYLISQLHHGETEAIARVFDQTGFWDCVADDPFLQSEWQQAFERAPNIKSNFHTVLSEPGMTTRLCEILASDPLIQRCFSANSIDR